MSIYEEARARIRGLALNVPTPFRGPEFEIDHEGLRRNLEEWIARDVPVILLTYGTSEFYSQTDAEIAEVTRTVVEAVAGRAFVVAATARWWLAKTVEFAHFCEDLGADCLMLTKIAPGFVGSPDEVLAWHEEVAGRTRIPLMYHQELIGPVSIELTKRIAAIENVVAMKQELGDYGQCVALAQGGINERLAVVSGAGAPLAHWAHQMGVAASLTGVGQWAPGPEARYVEKLLASDLTAAKRHLDIILPYRLTAARLGNHACIKHAMTVCGLAGGLVRPPGQNLTVNQKAEITPIITATRDRLQANPSQ